MLTNSQMLGQVVAQNSETKSETPPPENSEGLNFDAAPSIEIKTALDAPALNSRFIGETTGLSVVLGVVFLLASWILAKKIAAKSMVLKGKDSSSDPSVKPLSVAWHFLSLCVASFMGLNVFFFGGLTAFLLNGNNEDAQSYFAEISALKLSRLSHEHFFGYGILFGTVTALGLIFVGPKKRILFPAIVTFLFGALDAASWWLSHYVSFGFHTLSYITGAMFAAGFLALYLQIANCNLIEIFSKNSSFK